MTSSNAHIRPAQLSPAALAVRDVFYGTFSHVTDTLDWVLGLQRSEQFASAMALACAEVARAITIDEITLVAIAGKHTRAVADRALARIIDLRKSADTARFDARDLAERYHALIHVRSQYAAYCDWLKFAIIPTVLADHDAVERLRTHLAALAARYPATPRTDAD